MTFGEESLSQDNTKTVYMDRNKTRHEGEMGNSTVDSSSKDYMEHVQRSA